MRKLKTAKTTSTNAKPSKKASPLKAQPKTVSKAKTSKPVKVAKLDKKRCQRCSKFNPVEDSICNWCEKPVLKAVKVSKPKAAPARKAATKPAGSSDPLGIGGPLKTPCPHCRKPNLITDDECFWCEKPTRKPAGSPAHHTVGNKWKCSCSTFNDKGINKTCRKCGKPNPASLFKPGGTPDRLAFDPVTETYRVGAKPAGGQHGPSPTVTEEEANRRVYEASRRTTAEMARPEPFPPKPIEKPRVLTNWTAEPTGDAATAEHVIIIARAGTGKTTTLIGGTQKAQGLTPKAANGMPMVPSDQQRAVWDELARSKGVRTIGLTSFSNTIVDELKDRVRGTTVQAFTLHSYGWAAVRRAFRGVVLDKSGGLYKFMLADMMGRTLDKDLYKEKGSVLEAVNQLVKQCKMNLMEPTADNLDTLARHFDVEIPDRDRAEVYNYVPAILNKCKAVKPGGRVCFDDMIWLPIVLNLPVDQFDLLMVDEAQDLNRCQQALAFRAVGKTGRLVFCGDPRQAIFGFAGADNESMDRMERELGLTKRGVKVLKLTKTRRCGKAIVAEAQSIVEDFEAFESNPTGVVRSMRYEEGEGNFRKECRNRDMVVCRTNAPLVSQCFKFLREGKTAVMLGRSVGDKLVELIKKFDAVSIVDLIQKMEDWLAKERAKEEARRIPDENRLITLQDQFDCLMCFAEGAETVDAMVAKIDALFTDDRKADAIRLCSIHKAKGLEADRVFFIRTERAPCPHPMAKSDWAIVQEWNLTYVAITRAISELVHVN